MGKIWTAEDKCTTQRVCVPEQESSSSSSQPLLRGQRLIGQDGKLTKGMCAQGPSTGVTSCGVCLKSQATQTTCSQCERAACSSCTRQCSCCSSSCCSVCTTIE
uniref:Uncharacterized protein n=1 Tax=Knipowitschia caucasica TaxID=637954 RepID=A0AAV2JBM6_KNICA